MNKKYIIFGLVIIGAIIVVSNYQTIFKSILPPNPEIISSYSDFSSSSVFDFSLKVSGEVTNKGGDGYVVVKATAY